MNSSDPAQRNIDLRTAPDGEFRKLVLYCLVSNNVFSDKTNFYSALLPFFEPYVVENNNNLFTSQGLIEYSRTRLMLPLSEEVAGIFERLMKEAGWLEETARTESGIL